MSKNDNAVVVQEKIKQLAELTSWFESDDFTLEDAIKKFEEAKKVASEIEHDLDELKNSITVLKKDFSS